MITIPEKVEEIVNNSPYLREAMSSGLINYSALARQIQPQIAKELMKEVTFSSVLIALQRYGSTMKPYYQVNPADYLANLTLRSDLFEITVRNSTLLLAKLTQLSQQIQVLPTNLFIFTQGQYETTIITSSALEQTILKALHDEHISRTIPELTGISLQRTHGQIETTGVLQFPLRVLAWEGISVIEIVTTLNEIMVIVRDFEVDRAVSSLRKALRQVKSTDATAS